jgi:hypothetical protein
MSCQCRAPFFTVGLAHAATLRLTACCALQRRRLIANSLVGELSFAPLANLTHLRVLCAPAQPRVSRSVPPCFRYTRHRTAGDGGRIE